MRRLSLALAVAAAGFLALSAVPASASTGHAYSTSFAGSGTNALSTPTGVAIDNSALSSAGDVYVTDTTAERVEKFDSAGNFILMFGKGVNQTTGGDVCPVNPGDVCQAGSSGGAAGQFTTPAFVAVDSSAGLSAGDVYVADTSTHLVQKFAPDGTLITSWGIGGHLSGTTATHGPFGEIAGITVDSAGNLFVLKRQYNGYVFEFAQDGSFVTEFTFTEGVEASGLAVDTAGNFYRSLGAGDAVKFRPSVSGFASMTNTVVTGLAVDSSSGDFYVDDGTKLAHYHFNGFGQVVQADSSLCTPAEYRPCGVTDSFGSGNLTGAKGIAYNAASGTLYAADTSNHEVDVFTRLLFPNVTDNPASNVGQTSATVTGNVDPAGGGEVTDCHVEYVTEAAFQATRYTDLSSGGSEPCTPAIPPDYATATDVSASLTGLTAGTAYHFRLVAENATGPGASDDRTFTTDPAVYDVSTDPPEDVTQTSAILVGSFTGIGNATSFYFEWGSSTSYGHVTATPPGSPAGSPSGHTIVSAPITGLHVHLPTSNPYHCRLVATSPLGTTYGPDRPFYSAPPFLPQISGTSSLAVTPTAATLSAQINPGNGDTVYTFEYGPDTSYGSATPTSESIGHDNTYHAISAGLTGLAPGTTYHFRAVAINFGGTSHGPDQTFTTPDVPRIDLSSASGVTQTTAHLGAQVRPNSSATTVHFEYGTSGAYGQSTPESASIGSDASEHEVGVDISGLTPATTYHFRAVAHNAIGTTVGYDQTFTTALAPPSVPPPSRKCKPGFVRRHGKCVRKKHPKKHHKKHRRHIKRNHG